MSLNWKEIDLVLSELELEGCQIQKAVQPVYDLLALDLYGAGRTRRVLTALSPGACRIHETFLPLPKSEKPLRFAEFLKARLVNGRVEEAVQLGDNRIVRLTVRRGENRYRLYARLWSNAANVIVTDDNGVILDAMRRLPKRGEVSGGVYKPEAASPATAANTGADRYSVRELPGGASFNEKIDAFYAEHGPALSLEKLREKAARVIGGAVNRLETALERLREKEADCQNAARWKDYGDLVMANIAAIEKGASRLECAAFDGGGETIRIELDKTKSPVENAQGFYEKYRKAKSGLEAVQEEIREGDAEMERLRETEARFLAETNPIVLDRLIRKLRGSGVTGRTADAPAGPGKKRPGLSFQDGGWLLLVGRDGRENDELLRRHVKGNDLWLHARDHSGAFVFVKYRSGKTVPLEILLDAGNLALFYSGARGNGAGNCRYTQVKYLRRVKDGPPGKVIPGQEKNIFITIDQKRLKKLETARLRY